MENIQNDQSNYLKGAIEALLFVYERPVTLDQIKKVLAAVTVTDIKKLIDDLNQEYGQRQGGMKIVEIAGGYQMLSNPSYAEYIRSLYKTKHKEKLSKPALECLAIIAYKQPVTRAEVELIRGVNSDGVVVHLIEKELIKTVGRKDIPGKPFLYGTTKLFLEYFGLKSLENLPRIEDFESMVHAREAKEGIEESTEGQSKVEQPAAEPAGEQEQGEAVYQQQDTANES